MSDITIVPWSWDGGPPPPAEAPDYSDYRDSQLIEAMKRCEVEGHLFTFCPHCGTGTCTRCGDAA